MRVVNTDNFSGDYPNETFESEELSQYDAVVLAEYLNDKYSGNDAPRYYKVVPDDYVLVPGFEP